MKFYHNLDNEGFGFAMRFVTALFLVFAGGSWMLQTYGINSGSVDFDIKSNTASVVTVTDDKEEDISFERNAWAELLEKTKVQRLGFVGDIMLDRDIEKIVKTKGKGSFNFPFDLIRNDLKSYDLVFGNLEGPISDRGVNQGSIYSFRMDPKSAPAISDAGISVVSFANNHVGDWSTIALEDTMRNLAASGIVYSGAGFNSEEAYDPRYITLKDGTKIAFLSYTEFSKHMEAKDENSGIAIISETAISEGIEKAKENADIVVVSFHYGTEYKPEPNEFQERISKFAISKGADIVVGHHPHVVEPLVSYRDGYIVYSLGNFVFDQPFSKETMEGGFLDVEIQSGNIIKVELKKVRLNKDYQPYFEGSVGE